MIDDRPSMVDFGTRVKDAFSLHGQLCVGIDPSKSELRNFGLADDLAALEYFSLKVIEACQGRVGFIKPQVAFFERFGSAGFAILEKVLHFARESGLIVIADAKRGDIGSTLEGYAEAWLAEESPFMVDALTLSPISGQPRLVER